MKQRMWVIILLSVTFSALAGIGFMISVFSCAKQKELISVHEPKSLKSRYESAMDLDSYTKKLSTSKELSVEEQLSSGVIFENKGGLDSANTMAINLQPVANRDSQFIVTVMLKSGYRFDHPQDLKLPGIWSSSPQEYHKRTQVFWPEHLPKYESELSLVDYIEKFNRQSLEEKLKPGRVFLRLGGLSAESVKDIGLTQLNETQFTIRLWLNKGYEFSKHNSINYQHDDYWESQPIVYRKLNMVASDPVSVPKQPVTQTFVENEVVLPVLMKTYSASMKVDAYVNAFNQKSLQDKLAAIFANPGGLNEQNLDSISLKTAGPHKMHLTVLLKEGNWFRFNDGRGPRWETTLNYKCTATTCQKNSDVAKRASPNVKPNPPARKTVVSLPQFLTEISSSETKAEYIAQVNHLSLADQLASNKLFKTTGTGMNQKSVKKIWLEDQPEDKLKVHVELNDGYVFNNTAQKQKPPNTTSSGLITYQMINQPQSAPVSSDTQITPPEMFSSYHSKLSLKDFISRHEKESVAQWIRPNYLFKKTGDLSTRVLDQVTIVYSDDQHFQVKLSLKQGFVFKDKLGGDRQLSHQWTSALLSYKQRHVLPLPKFDAKNGFTSSDPLTEYSKKFNNEQNTLASRYRFVSEYVDDLKEVHVEQIELIPQSDPAAVTFKITLKPEYSFDESGLRTWTTPKIDYHQLSLIPLPVVKSSVTGFYRSAAEWFNALGTVDNKINHLFTLSSRVGFNQQLVDTIEYVPEEKPNQFKIMVQLKSNVAFRDLKVYAKKWLFGSITYHRLERVNFVVRPIVGARGMNIDQFIRAIKADYEKDPAGGIIDLFVNYHEVCDKIKTLSLSRRGSNIVIEIKLKDGFVTTANSDVWKTEIFYDCNQTGVINFQQSFRSFSIHPHDHAWSRSKLTSQTSLAQKIACFFPPTEAIPPMVLQDLRAWVEESEGQTKVHWELILKPGYVFSNGLQQISSLTPGYAPLIQETYALFSPKLVGINANQSATAYLANWQDLRRRYRHEDYLKEALTILTGLAETNRPTWKASHFKDILFYNGYQPGEVFIKFIAADGRFFIENNRYTNTRSEWLEKLNFLHP